VGAVPRVRPAAPELGKGRAARARGPSLAALNATVNRKGGFPSTAVPAATMASVMDTVNKIYDSAFRPVPGGLLKAFEKASG
jgi:hypothetical protein